METIDTFQFNICCICYKPETYQNRVILSSQENVIQDTIEENTYQNTFIQCIGCVDGLYCIPCVNIYVNQQSICAVCRRDIFDFLTWNTEDSQDPNNELFLELTMEQLHSFTSIEVEYQQEGPFVNYRIQVENLSQQLYQYQYRLGVYVSNDILETLSLNQDLIFINLKLLAVDLFTHSYVDLPEDNTLNAFSIICNIFQTMFIGNLRFVIAEEPNQLDQFLSSERGILNKVCITPSTGSSNQNLEIGDYELFDKINIYQTPIYTYIRIIKEQLSNHFSIELKISPNDSTEYLETNNFTQISSFQ